MAISLLGLGTERTKSGLYRIARILEPDIIIDTIGKGDEKDYDGILAHNHIDDPFNGKLPRILYLASYATAYVAETPKAIKRITDNMPTAIWVNQNMGRKLLKRVGIEAKTMYRPNRLVIPDSCPPPPNEKKILWHWMPHKKRMTPALEKEIVDAMRKLSGIEIRIINPSRVEKSTKREKLKPKGSGLEHVEAGGFLDLRNNMQDWHGIVRIYHAPQNLDFGRSTFQAFACGRWYVCRMLDEPFVTSVKDVKNVVPMVRKLLDNPDMKAAEKRWKYIKTKFNEKTLHARWVKAVKEVICG